MQENQLKATMFELLRSGRFSTQERAHNFRELFLITTEKSKNLPATITKSKEPLMSLSDEGTLPELKAS